jgi:hypothetical protein
MGTSHARRGTTRRVGRAGHALGPSHGQGVVPRPRCAGVTPCWPRAGRADVPRTGSSRPRRGRTAPGRRERVRRGRAALGHAPRRTMVGRAGAAQGAASRHGRPRLCRARRAVRRARAHHATPGRGGRATRRAGATPSSRGQAAPGRAARQGSVPGGLGRAQSREPRRGAMAGPRQGKKEE